MVKSLMLIAIGLALAGGVEAKNKNPPIEQPLVTVYCGIDDNETLIVTTPVKASVSDSRTLIVELSPTSRIVRFLYVGEDCTFISMEDAKPTKKGVNNDLNFGSLSALSRYGVRFFRDYRGSR